MRREYGKENSIAPSKECYFHAPLTTNNVPTIAWDGDNTVNKQTNCTFTDGSIKLNASSSGIVWNCAVPQGKNLTFSCWVKKVSGSGVNYNFGCGPKTTTTRYTGLNYSEISYCILMQEYLYFYYNPNKTYLTNTNSYTFITWTMIFNGGNSYTIKFYKNGILDNKNTITNTSWQEFKNCYFEIGHFTNSMVALNRHFTCHEELSDEEVLQLYNRGGVPE